jgi:hypothetical protein
MRRDEGYGMRKAGVTKVFSTGCCLFALLFGAAMISGEAFALPAGSYQNSCTTASCTDDGSTLRCPCRNKKGNTVNSGLVYGLCEGDIWNDNGTMKCKPRGSFKNSCSGYTWNESRIITVWCKKKNGDKNYGAIYQNWAGCEGDIANCDGTLTCGACP